MGRYGMVRSLAVVVNRMAQLLFEFQSSVPIATQLRLSSAMETASPVCHAGRGPDHSSAPVSMTP